jgi:type IV pilus assembly protein PilZ
MSEDTIRSGLDSPLSLIPLTGANAAVGSGSPVKSAGLGGLPAVAPGARPSVIQLVFREKGALYAAFIPVFTEGGLFVPTTRDYRLGEDIYLLLSLPDDAQRYPVAGKVAWITPANASGGRTQGVGVRFPVDEKTRVLRIKIEGILGTALQSTKPTQTI